MPSISIPIALIAGAAITAGTSAYGASQQAGAAQDAAQLQYQAAQQAAAQQWAMFQQMQGNLQPYMNTGVNALNSLGSLTGTMPANSGQISQLQMQLAVAEKAYGAFTAPGTGTGAGAMTPGMQAAMAYNSRSEQGGGGSALMDVALGPLGGNFTEQLFGMNNRSAIGDIWGALQEGRPISDASWASAGFGPGGTALPGAPAGTGGPAAAPGAGLPATPAGTSPGYSPGSLGQIIPAAAAGSPATGATGTPGTAGNPAAAAAGLPTDKAGLEAYIAGIKNQISGLQSGAGAAPGNPLTAPLTRPFQPTMTELEATPGYQFTLNQGLKATQNAATSMGLGQSGPAIAAAGDYAAGLASTTYQQQFGNYWTNNLNLYNMVSGLATMGQNAAAGVGTAGIQTAGAMGNMLTGGAAALGAGQVGAANAWAGAMGNIGSSLGSTGMMLAMNNNGLFGQGASPAAAALAIPAGNDASLYGASGYA